MKKEELDLGSQLDLSKQTIESDRQKSKEKIDDLDVELTKQEHSASLTYRELQHEKEKLAEEKEARKDIEEKANASEEKDKRTIDQLSQKLEETTKNYDDIKVQFEGFKETNAKFSQE